MTVDNFDILLSIMDRTTRQIVKKKSRGLEQCYKPMRPN